jgi:hypothetical protein
MERTEYGCSRFAGGSGAVSQQSRSSGSMAHGEVVDQVFELRQEAERQILDNHWLVTGAWRIHHQRIGIIGPFVST